MKKLAYVLLVIFLVVATAAVFMVVATLRGVQSITNPVGDLFRDLVVEATPVILPNPVIVVQEINSLARLETTSFAFQDILQIERNQDLLFGAFGETLLFVAYGEVIAGVDLSQMQPEDLQVVSPTTVIVHLPDSEIFLTDLDNERSYVANRDIGIFTDADPQLETLIRQEAEAQMLEAAMGNGILERADQEAQAFMRSFLQGLGFQEIIFTDETPPPAPPFIQDIPKGFVGTPAPGTTPAP